MVLTVPTANVQLVPVLEIQLTRGHPLIFDRLKNRGKPLDRHLKRLCWLHGGVDHPYLAVRVSPQEIRRATTNAVITRNPATDEEPSPFPLREGERLKAR